MASLTHSPILGLLLASLLLATGLVLGHRDELRISSETIRSELLPLKNQMVLRNVRVNCSRELRPQVQFCQQAFERELEAPMASPMQVCCSIYRFHQCVMRSVQRISSYGWQSCDETDVISTGDVLRATESHPQHRLLCPSLHSEHLLCEPESLSLISSNLFTFVILAIGIFALLVAILISGYLFYLSRITAELAYRRGFHRLYNQDVELKSIH